MNNISFFDGNEKFKIDKPIRLIELFAGIGAQAKSLENLGVDFEHYRICEFDKYAVASYNAVHGTNFATSDITKITADDLGIVDTDKYCYVMTYSFPCQDLSLAGKQRGMEKGAGTRSGLLWEVERLLDECKELPQVLLMENVPQVIGTKNIEHFAKWQEKLESLGYKNKWQILNAKGFGIPQNRERCFMVSILGDYYYEFPRPMKLDRRLKDLLETEVDEKYYLSPNMIKYISAQNDKWICNQKGAIINRDIAVTVNTRVGSTRCDCSDYICDNLPNNYDIRLHELTSGQSQTTYCGSATSSSAVLIMQRPHGYNKGTQYDNMCPTITTSSFQENNFVKNNYRIRKLTPKECWRLMGFDDAAFDRAKATGMSDAQLYKQAGNSIVVNVLVEIFKGVL